MPAWRATHTSHAARAGASTTFASDVRKCRNSRTPSRAARTKRRTGPTILNRLVQARCHVAEAERHVAPLGFRPTVYQPMQGVPRPPSGIAFLGDDEVHAFWRASPPFRVARTHRLSEAWQAASIGSLVLVRSSRAAVNRAFRARHKDRERSAGILNKARRARRCLRCSSATKPSPTGFRSGPHRLVRIW